MPPHEIDRRNNRHIYKHMHVCIYQEYYRHAALWLVHDWKPVRPFDPPPSRIPDFRTAPLENDFPRRLSHIQSGSLVMDLDQDKKFGPLISSDALLGMLRFFLHYLLFSNRIATLSLYHCTSSISTVLRRVARINTPSILWSGILSSHILYAETPTVWADGGNRPIN